MITNDYLCESPRVIRLFRYWILFDYTNWLSRSITYVESFEELAPYFTIPHLLERDIAKTLPVLWYCLHLPRKSTDLAWLTWPRLACESALDQPAQIVIAPIATLNSGDWEPIRTHYQPNLVFYPGDVPPAELEQVFPGVRAIPYREAHPNQLMEHWQYLASLVGDASNPSPPPFFSNPHEGATHLATAHFGRQLPGGGSKNTAHLGIAASFWHHDRALTVAKKISSDHEADDVQQIEHRRFIHNQDTAIHVAIASPGPHRAPFRWSSEAWDQSAGTDQDLESFAYDCMLAHHASATSGAGIRGFTIADECYRMLGDIERYYHHPKRKATTLRRLLGRFGLKLRDLLIATLTESVTEQMTVFRRARSITAFTSFPIGLMQFSSGETPLCMATPIAYRPAFPIGQILLTECMSSMLRVTQLQVLVLQCVSASEIKLIQAEETNWSKIDTAIRIHELGSVTLKMVDDIDEIPQHIASVRPNILVISGHGIEFSLPRVTAIRIGDKYLSGGELGPLPPIIILSSCSVAARGHGALSIAEVLIRNGAVAVLGAQIPIDYRRNARLLSTFFDYLIDAMNVADLNDTLLAVWHKACVENAIVDILFSSEATLNWGDRTHIDGLPLVRYLIEKRGEEIFYGLVYEHALAVLQECANETGFGQTFRSTISSQWYIPETTLYQLMGWPERLRIGRRLP